MRVRFETSRPTVSKHWAFTSRGFICREVLSIMTSPWKILQRDHQWRRSVSEIMILKPRILSAQNRARFPLNENPANLMGMATETNKIKLWHHLNVNVNMSVLYRHAMIDIFTKCEIWSWSRTIWSDCGWLIIEHGFIKLLSTYVLDSLSNYWVPFPNFAIHSWKYVRRRLSPFMLSLGDNSEFYRFHITLRFRDDCLDIQIIGPTQHKRPYKQ
jgi:hypothetical protein